MPITPHPKKSLGQYFLTCPWVITDMITAAHLTLHDTVVEIGPGTGVLTRPLAKCVKKVIAVEKDEHLADILRDKLQAENIINIDIIKGDILTNMPLLPSLYKVVANIPYYLTGRLFRLLLEEQNIKPISITLTIQKEVAKRIIAKPPHENLLALAIQTFGTPRIIATVPTTCFSPQPKVDSAIINISDISDNFFIQHRLKPTAFFRVAKLGFSQKRKILLNSLTPLADKQTLLRIFTHIGLEASVRPEQLHAEQWAKLTYKLT